MHLWDRALSRKVVHGPLTSVSPWEVSEVNYQNLAHSARQSLGRSSQGPHSTQARHLQSRDNKSYTNLETNEYMDQEGYVDTQNISS